MDKKRAHTLNGVNACSLVDNASSRVPQWNKHHSLNGHEFATEDANVINEIPHRESVDKVDVNDLLYRVNRKVNGIYIPIQYCQTAFNSISNVFGKDGYYRNFSPKTGLPQSQYKEAILCFFNFFTNQLCNILPKLSFLQTKSLFLYNA